MSKDKKANYFIVFSLVFFLASVLSVYNTKTFLASARPVKATVVNVKPVTTGVGMNDIRTSSYLVGVTYTRNGRSEYYEYSTVQAIDVGEQMELLISPEKHAGVSQHTSSEEWGTAIFLFIFSIGLMAIGIREKRNA